MLSVLADLRCKAMPPSAIGDTDALRAVIDAKRLRLAAPLDDLIKRSHDLFGRQRQANVDRGGSRLQSSMTLNSRQLCPSQADGDALVFDK